MKAVLLFTLMIMLYLSANVISEQADITITRINQYISDEGEFTILIESDKDFDKIQEFYMEGQKYVIDFWNARCAVTNANIFENSHVKQLNFWQIQTKPNMRVRMSFDLKQVKRPRMQVSANAVKISFEKMQNLPAGDNKRIEKEYKIGPGDILEFTVFENNDLTTICTVPEKSAVVLPLIGEVNITNLTVQEATDLIASKLKEYIRDPIINLKVKEYKSKWVNVMGEVRQPGKLYLKSTTYVLDLISEAGGFTEKAASDIIITRSKQGSQEMEKIIVRKDELSSENNKNNIEIFSEDTILIPAKKYYYMYGEIAKPGSFLLEEGTTVLKAITQAGGFTRFASKKNIEILRTDEHDQQKKIIINIRDIEERKSPDLEIKPDDIIRIPKSIL